MLVETRWSIATEAKTVVIVRVTELVVVSGRSAEKAANRMDGVDDRPQQLCSHNCGAVAHP